MKRTNFDQYHESLLAWLSIADVCGPFVLDVTRDLTIKLVRAARAQRGL